VIAAHRGQRQIKENTMTIAPNPRNIALARRRRITAAASTLLVAAGALAAGALGPAAPANAIPNCGNAPCPPPAPINTTPVPAPGPQFVSIAYSPDSRKAGFANSNGAQVTADKGAMVKCQKSGGRQCRIVITATNQCAALIGETPNGGDPNPGPSQVATGATPADAYNAAQAEFEAMQGIGFNQDVIVVRCADGTGWGGDS
jgi:hypothetical protein